jgi:cytochrome P450
MFPPIIHISRSINTTQIITTADRTYILPGPAKIYINNTTLQSYPSIWGSDSLEFRPSRWLTSDSTLGNPHFITPARGTYLPWSGGPRSCPGQKMSQVEFVAVMLTLFKRCRAAPVVKEGESVEDARRRFVDLMEDSQPRLTLQMNRPQDLALRWLRR